MPGCIRVCQDVYEYARMYQTVCQNVSNIMPEYIKHYAGMYTSTPGCIRVCQDVYEYARMYTSMPGCIKHYADIPENDLLTRK